jgi:excisionase family DNA binding protein
MSTGVQVQPRSPYLTTEAVAERYGVHPGVIRRWARAGTIPHIRPAGTLKFLFPIAELDAWDYGAELEAIESANGSRIVRTVRP